MYASKLLLNETRAKHVLEKRSRHINGVYLIHFYFVVIYRHMSHSIDLKYFNNAKTIDGGLLTDEKTRS